VENIEMTVDGHTLTLVIDLTHEAGLSASKKNMVIASTRGNVKIPGTDATFGLNVYKKPE
jgi:hypothetical protein